MSESTVAAKNASSHDRYRRKTKLQQQQIYGTTPAALQFIDHLCAGQQGEYHPQAIGFSPGKTFRILKDVAENIRSDLHDESKVGIYKRPLNLQPENPKL